MSDILPYSCCYENSKGEILRLDEAPILVQSSGLFDYQWNITAFDRALKDGGRAVSSRRPIQEKTLTLDVFADTQEEHNAALNRIHDVFDYDVCVLSPGKLWVNGQYIKCFIYSSYKTLDRDWTTYTVVGLTMKAINPAWTTEQTVTLLPMTTGDDDAGNKRYTNKYPYKYAEGKNVCKFVNETNSSAPMIIKIFGPCSSPAVYVNDNEYSVSIDIANGEYIIINQTDKTISHVGVKGQIINIFNKRKKSVDNFLYAPLGNIEVTCSGLFSCEITFLMQRSEPKWI